MLIPGDEDERPWLAFLAEGMQFAGRRSAIDLTICHICVSNNLRLARIRLPLIFDRIFNRRRSRAGDNVSVRGVNATNIVSGTAGAHRLAATFQLPSLTLIAKGVRSVKARNHLWRISAPSDLGISGALFAPRRFRSVAASLN